MAAEVKENKCRVIYPDERFKDVKEEKKERDKMKAAGMRFNADKCSKIGRACFYGYFDEFLKEINIKMDEDKSFDLNTYFETESEWSLLHFAMFGRKRCIKVMKDKSENYDHMKIIKWLIDNGIDVNIQSKWGYSILTECITNNPDQILTKYLLENNANPNLKTMFGTTPLISAVLCDNFEGIQLLCKYGADPRISNNFDGLTPIIFSKSFPKIFMYLTKIKLDLDKKDINNKNFKVTPITPTVDKKKIDEKDAGNKEDEKEDKKGDDKK